VAWEAKQHGHVIRLPAAIRFVLGDMFTTMRAEERAQLLHVSACQRLGVSSHVMIARGCGSRYTFASRRGCNFMHAMIFTGAWSKSCQHDVNS